MKRNALDASRSLITRFLKAACILALCLSAASVASAQQCDGCNVTLYGPDEVETGINYTYYAYPSQPNNPYYVVWDYLEQLSAFATIIDQGLDAQGREYIVLNFWNTGGVFLTFEVMYNGAQDFSEVYINITN